MANFKDCLYAYECNNTGEYNNNDNNDNNDNNNDNNNNNIKTLKETLVDVRVFDASYCDINYAEGYLLTGVKTGEKGKILHFVSNGIGDWEEKIKSIQENRLSNNDIAYFVVPEVSTIFVISKDNFIPLLSASKIMDNVVEISRDLASKVAKSVVDNAIITKVNEAVNNKVKNTNIEIKFVSTDKNEVYELETFSFVNNSYGVYKVPDNLKCGDYEVEIDVK